MPANGFSLSQRVRAFFLGRDVFISYCYADSAYAEALAVALQRLNFSVFLGAWGASPGEELSHEVSAAARHSCLLVVIATPASRWSVPVEDEIRYFADRTRPVIPVDLSLGLRDTKKDWPALAGTDVIREPHPETKAPSRPVIRRIRNAATFTRQTARLKRFIAAAFVIVASVTGGAALWSGSVVTKAQAEVAKAQTRVAEAREGITAANAQRIRSNLRSAVVDLKAFWAALRTRSVTQQAQFADADRRVAADSAEREAAIGSYIRMANDAAAMLDMQLARLGGAALQAVQAVRFLDKRGTRAPAADRILRQALDLLPLIRERTTYPALESNSPSTTADGRSIAARVSERTVAVVNTEFGTRQEFSVPPGGRSEAFALSDDGSAVAAAYVIPGERGEDRWAAAVWNLGDGSVQHVAVPPGIDTMALSNGGALLAVADSIGSHELTIVQVADSAVVASAALTDSFHELRFTQSGDVLAIKGAASGMWAWRTDKTPVTISPQPHELLLHPKDETIVGIAGLRTLQVRNWKTGETLWSLPPGLKSSGPAAAFSADGTQLAFITSGQAHMVQWKTPDRLWSFVLRPGETRDIAVVRPFEVVVAYADGSAEWHTTAGSRRLLARAVHGAEILKMVAKLDAIRTISKSDAMTWAPSPRPALWNIAVDPGGVAVSSDGSLIVAAFRLMDESQLAVHDEPRSELFPFKLDWTAVALGPDKAFYMGLRDGRVLRWNAAADVGKAEVVPVEIVHAYDMITALAVGRTGRAAFASGGSIFIADDGQIMPIHRGGHEVTALTFGPGDDDLAAGTANGEIRLWQRGRVTAFARKHRIESLAISPDGTYLAATAHPQPAAIWRVDRPDTVYELRGDPANAIAFHPTDGTVATGGHGGVVQVWKDWNQPRAVEVARFSSGSFVRIVRFTEDGRHLIAVPQRGEGSKWVWKNAELIADACRRLSPVRDTRDVGGHDVICAGPVMPDPASELR